MTSTQNQVGSQFILAELGWVGNVNCKRFFLLMQRTIITRQYKEAIYQYIPIYLIVSIMNICLHFTIVGGVKGGDL